LLLLVPPGLQSTQLKLHKQIYFRYGG